MAFLIQHPQIQLLANRLGRPARFRVTISVRFTPMECLLANYGLYFNVKIDLYDHEFNYLDPDDFLITKWFIIPSSTISGYSAISSSGSIIALRPPISIDFEFEVPLNLLKGSPDDEDSLSSQPEIRQIEARVALTPAPSNSMEVFGGNGNTSIVNVNISELIIDSGSFSGS